jgi:2-polyprenyl-6-methoxyphenol hydroxylase-like FAD-dependent oxidoreductase
MAKLDRVLIVGGGIAGLTLAAGLAQRGIGARVVEIKPQHQVYGVGFFSRVMPCER